VDVLLVAPDKDATNWLALAITVRGHSMTLAVDSVAAVSRVAEQPFGLVIIDDTLGIDRVVGLCRQIRTRWGDQTGEIWIIADRNEPGAIVEALDAGATNYLTRPVDAQQLRTRFKSIEWTSPLRVLYAEIASATERVLLSMHDAIVIVDAEGVVRRVNPRFEELLGIAGSELTNLPIVSMCHPDDAETLSELLTMSTDRTVPASIIGVRLRRSDQTWATVALHRHDMPAGTANTGVLLLVREIDDRDQNEEQMEYTSLFDRLTGLASKDLFIEHVSRSLARGERLNEPLVVMYLALDSQANTHATAGRVMTDEGYVRVADQIRRSIRSHDVAARLDRHAFAILMENIEGQDSARAVAQRIQSAIQQDVASEHAIVASVGIVLSRPGMTSLTDILSDADKALHQSIGVASRSSGASERTGDIVPGFPTPPYPGMTSTDLRDGSTAIGESGPTDQRAESRQLPEPPGAPSHSAQDGPEGESTSDPDNPDHKRSDVIRRFVELEAHLARLLDEERNEP
jgi:diguanylate cyclase (GGDEF)-like protein/PAS domain S-box-containing protein